MGGKGKPEAAKPAAAAPEKAAPKGGAPSQGGGHGGGDHGGGGAPSASRKGANVAKVGCHADACKDKDVRFNFCDEHFKQFKFGLITKTGEKVLDYERKYEHYQSLVRSQGGRKAG